MFVRLWLYTLCALVVAALFLFEPQFNWGGMPGVSLYGQSLAQGNIINVIVRVLTPAVVVFMGLLAYFGLGKSKE